MKNPEFLQTNLQRMMDSKGWSLKKMALESGVSYHTVFRAISKGVVSRGGNLQKMAKALGVEVSDLWMDPSKTPVHEAPERATDEILKEIQELKKEISELRALAPSSAVIREILSILATLNDDELEAALAAVTAIRNSSARRRAAKKDKGA